MDGSYKSAQIVAEHLNSYYQPKEIVDVGCGRGTWLKAFKELGVQKLVGLDGSWNSQTDMVDEDIVFQQEDLNNPSSIAIEKRYDMAISLEVAEHLEPEGSVGFVALLTALSDVVLFSAAFNKQGGKDHINERLHSCWAEEFAKYGFRPYDLFRPVFWGNPDVRFWYQQNCFLYVKEGSDLAGKLASMGQHPLTNLAFMNCIHPRLYARYTKPPALTRLKTKIKKRMGQQEDNK
ncbi:class I SAM-dependent methyltransferase [Yoonia sp. GPGPB17]|uniref:class I SAM-dependent methyltransferase n=1 Tax=Yoonia sp. GPGPB17 TaxID=3026147 RepID=UPI0030BBC2A3